MWLWEIRGEPRVLESKRLHKTLKLGVTAENKKTFNSLSSARQVRWALDFRTNVQKFKSFVGRTTPFSQKG